MVVSFSTEVLDGLCSKDQLELLNAIDRLRLQGIDHYISLPQIIVCGDQSSGKSSVLEAISGVPFPVQSNLCTRFPTELVLRRTEKSEKKQTSGVCVSIVPHADHGQPEKTRLEGFHKDLAGFDGLPALVDSARTFMGLTAGGKGFSRDLLRVEISGPDRPHLTIVDLPGLIHSETKQQTAAEVELVQEVVKSYMLKSRSVILAVVSAKNDFANQIVLKLARSADPLGERTLGVITKPDTLVAGSGSEASYLSLANNQEVEFSLGWHVLKNLDSERHSGSLLLHQRNTEEKSFFSQGVWATLSASQLGIASLRDRLAELLPRQTATELPSLITEITAKLTSCHEQLEVLGEPRATPSEQRLLLLRVSQEFQRIVQSSVDGTYKEAFFESAESARGYSQRIRAVVQNLNDDFADMLEHHGHRRQVRHSDKTTLPAPRYNSEDFQRPELVTRDEYIKHIQNLMERSRGTELPGKFNPTIGKDLFIEQSAPWEAIVNKHVERVWNAAMEFLTLVAYDVCEQRLVSDQLNTRAIKPKMDEYLLSMKQKVDQMLKPHRSFHPITYDNSYPNAMIKNNSDEERKAAISQVIRDTIGDPTSDEQYIEGHYLRLATTVARLVECTRPSIKKDAAAEALESLKTYYKIALKRFIDSVAIEVIEEKLLGILADILSPVAVFRMSDEMVEAIAGESKQSQTDRGRLTKQIAVLENGSETCKRFAGAAQ